MKLTKLMMMVIASALVCYGSVAFSSDLNYSIVSLNYSKNIGQSKNDTKENKPTMSKKSPATGSPIVVF